jgi:hypothetical protein
VGTPSRKACCLHLHGGSSKLSETSVNIYQITRFNISEDSHLHVPFYFSSVFLPSAAVIAIDMEGTEQQRAYSHDTLNVFELLEKERYNKSAGLRNHVNS